MYAIYGNIYHQYTPNVSINIPYMDPMGMAELPIISCGGFVISYFVGRNGFHAKLQRKCDFLCRRTGGLLDT